MKINSNFAQILILAGLDLDKAEEGFVLGSNEKYLRMGSVYSEGDWTYDENTGVATRTTCGFNNQEDKLIYIDKYVNDAGKLVCIGGETI